MVTGSGRLLALIVIAALSSSGCTNRNPESNPDPPKALGGGDHKEAVDSVDISSWDPWNQMGGGAGHPGYAPLPAGPLDVIASGRMRNDDAEVPSTPYADFVATKHGLVSFTNKQTTCTFRVFSDLARSEPRIEVPTDCYDLINSWDFGLPIAYDPTENLAFTCGSGGRTANTPPTVPEIPVLRAWNPADGTVAWETLGSALVDSVGPIAEQVYCDQGFALSADGSKIYVGMSETYRRTPSTTSSYIVIVNAKNGQVTGRYPLPPYPGAGIPALPPEATAYFTPYSISLTSSGLVIIGRSDDTKRYPSQGNGEAVDAVVWLGLQGEFNGIAFGDSGGDLTAPNGRARQSAFASSRDDTAAFAMGEDLYFVNPGSKVPPTRIPLDIREQTPGGTFQQWAGPAWWADHVVVPSGHGVSAYPPRNEQSRWNWQPVDPWTVDNVLIGVPDSVFVLAHRNLGSNEQPNVRMNEAVVFEIRLSDGREVRKVPVPLDLETGTETQRKRGTLTAIENVGLLATDWRGGFALLGTSTVKTDADAEPRDSYPPERTKAVLRVHASDADLIQAHVAWADGKTESFSPPIEVSIEHEYATAGRYAGYVTFLFADQRTHSMPFEFRVGETPPPRLNPAQRAFSSDNQEITFFILGLALTTAGASYAIVRRRGHRGRLGLYIEELRSIRRTGRDDPNAGLPELASFRRRLREHWQSGRLDESGYLAVESRAQAATRLMTSLFLDELTTKPGSEFSLLLQAALDDGELSTRELGRLEAALRDDAKLAKKDRTRVRDLFDAVVHA